MKQIQCIFSYAVLQYIFCSVLLANSLLDDSSLKTDSSLDTQSNKNHKIEIKTLPNEISKTTQINKSELVKPVTLPSSGTVRNASVKHKPNVRQRLRKHLLEHYDVAAHPVDDHTTAVNVSLGMSLLNIDIDELKSTLKVDAWIRMAWLDVNLQWNPDDFEGLSSIHFATNELWKPDITLYNNAESTEIDHYGNTHFLVDNSGNVLWVPPARLNALCSLDLRLWPRDKQICKLKLGSWTSNGLQINLQLYRNSSTIEHINHYTNNNHWEVLKSVANVNVAYYTCCPEPYPDITFTFHLERRSPAYRILYILPCLAIMLMTASSFIMSPVSSEKITINLICFLTTIIYLVYFATIIPFHADSAPLIVIFFGNTAVLIGFAVLINVVCLSIARDRKYNRPAAWIRHAFAGEFGKCLCLGNYYHQVSATHERIQVELTDMAECDRDTLRRSSVISAGNINHTDTNDHSSEANVNSSILDYQESRLKTHDDDLHNKSKLMLEWTLVAAGVERIALIIYFIAFVVVLSVYV